LANRTGILWVIEPYLPLTIGGPPAIPAGIPAGDPRIGLDRSVMQYGITPSFFPPATKLPTLAHPKLSASDPIET
jgi:hypothetical protein